MSCNLTTMMNYSPLVVVTAAMLLAISTNKVCAFAPRPSRLSTEFSAAASLHRYPANSRGPSSLPLSPGDFSFLISDAIDAASDIASASADAGVAASAQNAGAAGAFAGEVNGSFMPTYSRASYYTTLALYVASFPGLWSQIKRSTKAKVKRKTYISPGENAERGKDVRQQAGEIMAYMTANNYEVAEAGETITFRGIVARSTSQAFFLTFCTALGMASLALVLQIQFQDLGIYYWRSGDRVDDMKVKLSTNDDETLNEVTIEGNDEEIDRMWRTLDLQEKGMVKVEGILG